MKKEPGRVFFALCCFLTLFLFFGCTSSAAQNGASAQSSQSASSQSGKNTTGTSSQSSKSTAGTSSQSSSTAATASKSAGAGRKTVTKFVLPEASGKTTYGNDVVAIDASNTANGYLMLKYTGKAKKVKVQITLPDKDKTVYTYTLNSDDDQVFSLSGGDGTYHADVLENAYENKYSLAFSQDIQVKLKDEFQPFLNPMQYCWYTKDSEVLKYGIKLSDASKDDLDYITNVYHDVIENVTYDKALAKNITADYIPDPDATLKSHKGICFDYAALMTALLRSQGIPTKLEVGYSGKAYHAWISVYTKSTGWIDKIIQFDGKNWTLMDPTLAANNSASSVGKYIGDGSNYTVKYNY